MMRYAMSALLGAAAVILSISCAGLSGGPTRKTDGLLFGMLYDHENNPIQGVSVSIDGEGAAESDVLGRFVVTISRPGNHSIALTKAGYEPVESSFSFEPTAMLYYRMITASQLIVEAERSLDAFDAASALACLDRALRLEPFRYDALFLRSVALAKAHDGAGAKKALDDARSAGYAGRYADAFARMLEADE